MTKHQLRHAAALAKISVLTGVVAACNGGFHESTGKASSALITSQQIAVPAYFSDWSGLLPNVPPANVIVMNPNNGPASGYATQLAAAHAKGARVLGYVYTKWANTKPNPLHGGAFDRTVAAVNADIDQYYSLYPSLDGIFEDESTGGSDCAHASSYYQPIYDHIKGAHPSATVIINPGTSVDPCYLSATTIAVTFESTFSAYQNNWSGTGRAWETPDNAARIWHIVHTADSSQLTQALDLSRQRNAGYVYVTSLTESENTFGSLPSYFGSEAANVNAFNAASGGGGAGPTALSRWRGSNDGANDYYSFHFSQPFSWYRVYIDSDHSAATGFATAGIGADYLIENGSLYAHGAAGWNWSLLGSSGQTTTANSTAWTISRATIGQTAFPNTDSLVFEAETSGNPIHTTAS